MSHESKSTFQYPANPKHIPASGRPLGLHPQKMPRQIQTRSKLLQTCCISWCLKSTSERWISRPFPAYNASSSRRHDCPTSWRNMGQTRDVRSTLPAGWGTGVHVALRICGWCVCANLSNQLDFRGPTKKKKAFLCSSAWIQDDKSCIQTPKD